MGSEVETYSKGGGEVRARGRCLTLPIVVGTVSFFRGKKATDQASHKWTVYCRHPDNLDITHIIERVTFKLHPTFNNNIRELSKPPFELSELGWGEFEIVAVLHLAPDAQEERTKTIEIYHRLKLYKENEQPNTRRPVVNETFEEIVFNEPKIEFYNRVVNFKPPLAPKYSEEIEPWLLKYDEEESLAQLKSVRQRLAEQRLELVKQLQACQ